MGLAKSRWIELEALGMKEPKDTHVCSKHISDYAIQEYISTNSIGGTCSYCKRYRDVVRLEHLMGFMMKGIIEFYTDAANFMGYDSSEGGYLGDTYSGWELINEVIGIEIDNDQLNEDISLCIDDRPWSSPHDYYDTEKDLLFSHWTFFKKIVKKKSRYLFSSISEFKTSDYRKRDAYSILEEIGDKVYSINLINKISSNTDLFRCRQHKIIGEVREAKDMAAPPDQYAIYSNRMSPAGVSMFYCAFDISTSVKETIDITSDKGLMSTAVFRNKEELTILDFTQLPPLPSIFDRKGVKHYYSIGFLIDFVVDLASDIKRDGREHIDYVPTQIVTEFFRYIYSKNKHIQIDGIVYPSSKNKGQKACVLFMDSEESLTRLNFEPKSLKTQKIHL